MLIARFQSRSADCARPRHQHRAPNGTHRPIRACHAGGGARACLPASPSAVRYSRHASGRPQCLSTIPAGRRAVPRRGLYCSDTFVGHDDAMLFRKRRGERGFYRRATDDTPHCAANHGSSRMPCFTACAPASRRSSSATDSGARLSHRHASPLPESETLKWHPTGSNGTDSG